MHWVIQRSIFKPGNYEALVGTLDALGIEYTTVAIKNGTFDMEPDVNVAGKVYICGAIKLTKIAVDRAWSPGSFLNAAFNFKVWRDHLGDELFNADALIGTLATIATGHLGQFFIRPLEDNKAFDGMLIDTEMLSDWRRDPAKRHLADMQVLVSPVKPIYQEYRLFVVNRKIVTGSVYKVGGKAQVSHIIDAEVLTYAASIIDKWVPAESFVIDICLGEHGLKVVEFNNINSSGFYASDVQKYVEAIQEAYA